VGTPPYTDRQFTPHEVMLTPTETYRSRGGDVEPPTLKWRQPPLACVLPIDGAHQSHIGSITFVAIFTCHVLVTRSSPDFCERFPSELRKWSRKRRVSATACGYTLMSWEPGVPLRGWVQNTPRGTRHEISLISSARYIYLPLHSLFWRSATVRGTPGSHDIVVSVQLNDHTVIYFDSFRSSEGNFSGKSGEDRVSRRATYAVKPRRLQNRTDVRVAGPGVTGEARVFPRREPQSESFGGMVYLCPRRPCSTPPPLAKP
jgi:hypothetical protein